MPAPSLPDLPLVVYCAGSSWDAPMGTDRHIASRLSRWATVVYVDPSVSLRPKNLGRLLRADFEQAGEGVLRLTPRTTPGATYRGLRDFAQFNARRFVAAKIRSLERRVHAVVIASLDDLFGISAGARRVFFGTDDFVAGASLMSLDREWVLRREAAQLKAATDLVAASQAIAGRWRAQGRDVTVVQNGCDTAAFSETDTAPPAPAIRLPHPIASVVGQLSDRLDWSYLEAVADRGVSLLLVGPVGRKTDGARFSRLVARENVQWLGPVPFSELPSCLRATKVGLTPYADSAFNRASFPLKTLEYLAAGRAVVSSDLPSCRLLDTGFIRIAATAHDFADAVQEELRGADDERLRRARQAFAARHDWDGRAREFAAAIGLIAPAGA